MFTKELLSIQRVQNPSAWAAYYSRVKLLAARRKSSESVFVRANEYWMKHGTRLTDIQEIARGEQGLDYRYCTGGYYGKGAYTAEDAAYADGYRYKYPDGMAAMFLVRVAAGRIFEVETRTQEHSQYIKPPVGNDSVRGDVAAGQKAIIVYQTDSAYPAYILTYRH
jgi:hypothetical protein